MNIKKSLSELTKKHQEKLKSLKRFIFLICGYGILINYALLVTLGIPFKWWGFPAFGIIYYFVIEEFVTFFRKLKARNIQ